MRLYDDLSDWYDLIDPVADHADEAADFLRWFAEAGVPGGALLELGCGAGNNASFLGGVFSLTLTDLAPKMLARSVAQNPGATHHLGDMRTLRLGRVFDAVLVHDAVVYLTTEDDLRAAIFTAAAHLRPGGVAIFAPDAVADGFVEGTELHEGDDGARAMRCVGWSWDPDPTDTRYVTEYVFVLRERGEVRVVHDRHVEGLFPIATWERLFAEGGLQVRRAPRVLGPEESPGYAPFVFVATRPDVS